MQINDTAFKEVGYVLCIEFTRTKLAGKRPLIVETQRSHTAIICTWIPKEKKKVGKNTSKRKKKFNKIKSVHPNVL